MGGKRLLLNLRSRSLCGYLAQRFLPALTIFAFVLRQGLGANGFCAHVESDRIMLKIMPLYEAATKHSRPMENIQHGCSHGWLASPRLKSGRPWLIGVLLAVLGQLSSTTPACAQTAEPSTMLISRQALALNSETGKVYAVETDRNVVSVFDPQTKSISRIPVGAAPVAIAVNTSKNRVYVANSEGGSVSVIDGKNDSVMAAVEVGPRPYALAVNPATNRIYVSNVFSDVVTVVDGATNATTKVTATSADSIVADSKLDKVYLLGYEDTNLTVLGVLGKASSVAGKIRVGIHAWGMALNELTGTVFVTRLGSSELLIIDEVSGLVKSVPTGAIPCAVAINPVTNRAYVANYGDNSLAVIDAKRRTAIAVVKTGQHPESVAVNPRSNRVYVANTQSDDVTVIDGSHNRVVKTVRAGKNPYALTVDRKTGRLFVMTHAYPALVILEPDSH